MVFGSAWNAALRERREPRSGRRRARHLSPAAAHRSPSAARRGARRRKRASSLRGRRASSTTSSPPSRGGTQETPGTPRNHPASVGAAADHRDRGRRPRYYRPIVSDLPGQGETRPCGRRSGRLSKSRTEMRCHSAYQVTTRAPHAPRLIELRTTWLLPSVTALLGVMRIPSRGVHARSPETQMGSPWGSNILPWIWSIASKLGISPVANPLSYKGFGGARGIRTLDPSYPGYRISSSC